MPGSCSCIFVSLFLSRCLPTSCRLVSFLRSRSLLWWPAWHQAGSLPTACQCHPPHQHPRFVADDPSSYPYPKQMTPPLLIQPDLVQVHLR
ncbi:hypothetical protein V8C86DRAFT_2733588 [Haematococcus lacustris]